MAQAEDHRPEGDIGVTEGVRRTTGVAPIGGRLKAPDPEVVEKKARRRFTARSAHGRPRQIHPHGRVGPRPLAFPHTSTQS